MTVEAMLSTLPPQMAVSQQQMTEAVESLAAKAMLIRVDSDHDGKVTFRLPDAQDDRADQVDWEEEMALLHQWRQSRRQNLSLDESSAVAVEQTEIARVNKSVENQATSEMSHGLDEGSKREGKEIDCKDSTKDETNETAENDSETSEDPDCNGDGSFEDCFLCQSFVNLQTVGCGHIPQTSENVHAQAICALQPPLPSIGEDVSLLSNGHHVSLLGHVGSPEVARRAAIDDMNATPEDPQFHLGFLAGKDPEGQDQFLPRIAVSPPAKESTPVRRQLSAKEAIISKENAAPPKPNRGIAQTTAFPLEVHTASRAVEALATRNGWAPPVFESIYLVASKVHVSVLTINGHTFLSYPAEVPTQGAAQEIVSQEALKALGITEELPVNSSGLQESNENA